jgi:hypothetical protein
MLSSSNSSIADGTVTCRRAALGAKAFAGHMRMVLVSTSMANPLTDSLGFIKQRSAQFVYDLVNDRREPFQAGRYAVPTHSLAMATIAIGASAATATAGAVERERVPLLTIRDPGGSE